MRRNLVPIESITFWINAFTLLMCLTLTASACQSPECPKRFLIPKDYVGWVVVYYNIKGAPPIKKENGLLLYRIPASGRLETSSAEVVECNEINNEYYYVDADGKRHLIEKDERGWYRTIQNTTGFSAAYEPTADGGRQVLHAFFVGTEEQKQRNRNFNYRRPQDIN